MGIHLRWGGVLDEAAPDTGSASIRIEILLEDLGILVKNVILGPLGPRGVAFAGSDLKPTIKAYKAMQQN